MVIVIMGVVGAIVVPQILHAGTMTIQAAARIVIADVIYAQNDAIAHQVGRRVVFDLDSNCYTLTDLSGTVLTAAWKGNTANNYAVDFDQDGRFSGVTLDTVAFGGADPLVLEFDDMGSPRNGGTVDLVYENTRYRVTVAEFTGRITVAPVP